MTCKTVEATIWMERYPIGGSSHGDTCCLCGNRFVALPLADQDDPDAKPRQIRVLVEVNGWRLQADTEGCAAILARWMALASPVPARRALRYTICLAHTCTAVVEAA